MSDELRPPESTGGDIAHAAIRSVLSAIPVAGGPAVEIWQQVLATPLAKRQREWMNAVAEALERLQDQDVRIRELADNPAFIDAVMRATQAAIRTSRSAKLAALRNAVANAALPNAPPVDLQQLFLAIVDDLTVWHLAVLSHFGNPRERAESLRIGEHYGRRVQSFGEVFPELYESGDGDELLEQIWRDLLLRGLVSRGHGIQRRLSQSMWFSKETSPLGDQLLRFISNPTTTAAR